MPKKLFNVDHQPALVNHTERAVMPGQSYVFTDEQVAAGIAGLWSEDDPRTGLGDERAFKLARDLSRSELDEQAQALGLDPSELSTKQDVAAAIVAAQDQDDEPDDEPDATQDPAESGETEE